MRLGYIDMPENDGDLKKETDKDKKGKRRVPMTLMYIDIKYRIFLRLLHTTSTIFIRTFLYEPISLQT